MTDTILQLKNKDEANAWIQFYAAVLANGSYDAFLLLAEQFADEGILNLRKRIPTPVFLNPPPQPPPGIRG